MRVFMVVEARQKPQPISPVELDAVLERARVEGWRKLALVSFSYLLLRRPHTVEGHTFYLREPLGARISKLPALTALTSLGVLGNLIGDEGTRVLAALTGLISLDLSGNQIGAKGARSLTALTGLTSLRLNGNQIGDEGARSLAVVRKLTSLALSGNQIGDEGALSLAAIRGLTSLDLSRNQIGAKGARSLTALTRLTFLDLSRNQIGHEGARALAVLTGLTSVAVSRNQIGAEGVRALLDAWCDASNSSALRRLDLQNNGDMMSLLPPEILKSYDAQSILAAYRRYREAKRQHVLRPLNEVKLVVVGNEAVGKTSLIRYLVHDRPRDPDEQKTPGAAIHEKIEVSAWSMNRSAVHLNVWDFGGQEIMRGTHRFFLTERSLYLLVLEDRREDDRSIHEWLEISHSAAVTRP